MDNKKNIIDSLTILKNNAKVDGEFFKVRAYEKVINNINNITEPIISFQQIENIDGVGKSIKQKLKEIIISGNKETEKNDVLLKIYGVGPKKAKELIEIHNITNIENLRIKVKENSSILTEAQKIGLNCYEDLLERIPRKEMLEHQKILNLKDKGEIVGSFRRKEKDSGDIDIMLNMNLKEFNEYIDNLIKLEYIKFTLARGEKKLLGICSLPNKKFRRIDLIRNTEEEYPYMKLYFTGPKEFNISFRNHCLSLGLSLNEHKFTPEVKGLKTEKDIFEYVGLKYIEPENRKEF